VKSNSRYPRESEELTESIPEIYHNCTETLATKEPSAAARMSSTKSLDSGLNRQRKRLRPALPRTLEDIVISEIRSEMMEPK